jgi:integrase/recombinase XerD
MTQMQPAVKQLSRSALERLPDQSIPRAAIDRVLQKLSRMEFPEKEHVERYIHHKWRMNHKPGSLSGAFKAIDLFLSFYTSLGKTRIEEIKRDDIEAFIENEQDRGTKITSAGTRLKYLTGFLHFLIDQNVLPDALLRKKIRLRLPEFLPRAMNPEDVRRFVSVLASARDRAMFLTLLRTGMRIGEVLALKANDIDIREKKIFIFEGEKNSLGRVVYLSDDALFALKLWLTKRSQHKDFVFYGQARQSLGYSSARARFVKCLKKAVLEHKGYTIHSLRHTFASELLNAGMRLECLQQLLGHQNIEMTRRYARLTDKTREEEYHRAMAVIEEGGIHGQY